MRTMIAILVLIAAWMIGLLVFAARVQQATPPDDPPRADGIVALTGASDARIVAGMRLLENGKGRRLLISGVNPEVRPEELREILPGSNAVFDCCVDLGFVAQNTMGNAQEIADWTRQRGFESLIVVTSDYHMPRSLLEIRGMAGGVELIPYAVATPSLNARDWWKSDTGLRRMVLEYNKYLVVLVRETVLAVSGGREGDAEAEPAGATAS